ncbi:hypothetical protein KJ815_05625, partial [bacterium]|nr:hypothetical protein [bacterium]
MRVEYRDGRPVRVKKGGTEIQGLSYDSSIKSYYTRVGGRKKNLGRDLAAAIVKLQDEADLPAKVKVSFELDRPLSLRELSDSREAFGAKLKAARAVLATEDDKPPAASQNLSDCLRFWTEWKTAETCRQSYIDETERCFNEFISEVGDKPVNHLAKSDFVGFERFLIKSSKGRKGNDWYARRLKSLRAVLNLCYQKTEYPFPADLQRWYHAIKQRPVVPAKESAEPIPVSVFRDMLLTLREWAVIDVEAMPRATQTDRARRNRAYVRKRAGVQWQAILLLACNCSLGNEDVCCIRWDNLKLRVKLPYLDFPRTKQERRIGRAIERKTPLLPSTIR